MESAHRLPQRPVSAKLVLLLTLSLGTAYALLDPPFAGSEERERLALLAELADFKLTSAVDADRSSPLEFEQLADKYEALANNPEARVDTRELAHDLALSASGTTSQRVPQPTPQVGRLADLPLLPGYLVGRLFGLSILGQLYLARIAGVIYFALLASWASAQAGRLGWAFFVLATLPMALLKAGSVAGEALSHGLSLVFFALIARTAYVPTAGALDPRARVIALASFAALVMCQPLMLTASLCFLPLPADAAMHPLLRGRRLFLLALLVGGLSLLLWMLADGSPLTVEAGARRDQLQFMLTHPIRVLFGLARSLSLEIDTLLLEFAAFPAPLANMARFSGGAIALLGCELLLLSSLGVNRAPTGVSPDRPKRAWLVVSLVSYGVAASLSSLLTQGEGQASQLLELPTRTFALMAPALVLSLSATGRPGLAHFLLRSPRRRVLLPLLLINTLALATLVGRYFVAPEHRWPY